MAAMLENPASADTSASAPAARRPRGVTGQRGQVLARIQGDGLDPRLARSVSLARAALPSPDLGLMNNTGRRGGSTGCQPEADPVGV